MKKLGKGMFKDTARVDQPEGTMRDALNANINIKKGSISNEWGTTEYPANANFRVIGRAVLDNDVIVMFGKQVNADGSLTDQIRTLDTRNQEVIVLYENNNLNFQLSHPIVTTHRKNQAGHYLVYFTDGYKEEEEIYTGFDYVTTHNPPRVINITKQQEWRFLGGFVNQLYNPTNSHHKLQLVPRVGTHAYFGDVDILSGGALPCAAYYLAIAYADRDGLETNYFTLSNPVYIVQAPENVIPTSLYIGAEGGTETNKSIRWVVRVPADVDYEQLQPVIIKKQKTAVTAVKLKAVDLNRGGSTYVTYTGNEDAAAIAVEDVIVDNVNYITAETLDQLDNRLYLGNVSSNKDIGFQPFAHYITVEPYIKTYENFNPRVYDTFILNNGYANLLQDYWVDQPQDFLREYSNSDIGGGFSYTTTSPVVLRPAYQEILNSFMQDGASTNRGYRNPDLYYKEKSYRRGEVYAFYISFVLLDGTETYAYHIPGRYPVCVQTAVTGQQVSTLVDVCEDYDMQKDAQAIKNAFGLLPGEFLDHHRDARLYQVIDTSYEASSAGGNGMGFWRNENETYPVSKNFLLGQIDAEGGVTLDPDQSMSGENVRHHKMPGNHGQYTYVSRVTDHGSGANGTFGDFPEQANKPDGTSIRSTSALGDSGGIVQNETIKTLGIRLNNIRIPRQILSQVQGYKVYYAKRGDKDRTILGQSLAIPGHHRLSSVPKQNLEEAIVGPYTKAFYMYGGLDHTDGSTVHSLGRWKAMEGFEEQTYYSHPVFKFHDMHMLRKRKDLTEVTHVQAQYAVMFRTFQGGPGVFVPPAQHSKIWDGVKEMAIEDFASSVQQGLPDYITRNSEDGLDDPRDAYATTFPSLGWVSPELRNTVDFFWYDPKHEGEYDNAISKHLFGESRVLDITDVQEGAITTIFGTGSKVAHEGTDDGAEKKAAKRARKYRRGEDLTQPAEGKYDSKAEQLLAVKAKEARVRAWYTSTMLGTAYIAPSLALGSTTVIKGGDYKLPLPGATATTFTRLNRFYQEGNFANNCLTLVVDPGSKILLHGKDDHKVEDVSSFKGAQILYNRSGETSYAFGLVSGLPALRGHAPFGLLSGLNNTDFKRGGLVRWGEAFNYLYPDALKDHIPLVYQLYGKNTSHEAFAFNLDTPELYTAKEYRGVNYRLQPINQYYGHPMAWLLNVCAIRANLFDPFDEQQLVYTGHYTPILNVDLETGQANNNVPGAGFRTDNYYTGGNSDPIYGGDTYVTRTTFRTTSQSYGHSYFRANRFFGDPVASSIIGSDYFEGSNTQQENVANLIADSLFPGDVFGLERMQTEIPTNLDNLKISVNAIDRFGTTNGSPIWDAARLKIEAEAADNNAFDVPRIGDAFMEVVTDSWNWVKGNVNPVSTVFSFITESDDLLEWRHVDDEEKGQSTQLFDYHTAASTIFTPPSEDFTHPDKILYEDHLSSLQDMKVTSPLPMYGELALVQTFPNRVVRSDVDSGSLADGYRKFRALEYKDIPGHRGDIRNLFSLNNNLYIHTERSLFVTKGKEELQLDAVTAFIGTGNIFAQDPDETMEADTGYAGTTSRHCHITTAYGHFYLNYRDKKFYNVSPQGIQDITNGMETWLRDNIPFIVEEYGINLESEDAVNNGFYVDATTELTVPIGFTMGYDPLFKRILITKHEPVPTRQFLEDFWAGNIVIVNNIPELINGCDDSDPGPFPEDPEDFSARGQQRNFKVEGFEFCGPIGFGNPKYFTQGGWTVSYYPEMKVWGSRHSYRPRLYTNTSEFLISFSDTNSWEHTNKENPGRFYGQVYNFEVEYIDNTGAGEAKLFSNMFYWAESFLPDQNSVSEQFRVSNPVFDEFYAYNSTQITGLPTTINYLNNARLVDRMWYINEIRDLSVQQELTEGELITGTENVAGTITTSVTVHPQNITMFTEEGVVNNNYVNVNKEWYNRRKMIDHYLGVRLIKDNTNRNLVHLYAVGTKFRKSFR